MGKTEITFVEDTIKDTLWAIENDISNMPVGALEESLKLLNAKEGEDRAEQLGKKIYSGQFFDKKSDMIVCYTRCFYGEHERHTSSDYIEAFRKENKRAFARYEELLKEDDIYSASICAVIDSTDYDGMWDSEVGEISNG